MTEGYPCWACLGSGGGVCFTCLAAHAAQETAKSVGASTFALGAAVGPFYDKLLHGVGGATRARSALQAAGVEALQEGPQSYAEQYQTNEAVRDAANPDLDPKQGALANAAEGALFGGLTGGATGAAFHRNPVPAPTVDAQDTKNDQTAPESPHDVAAAINAIGKGGKVAAYSQDPAAADIALVGLEDKFVTIPTEDGGVLITTPDNAEAVHQAEKSGRRHEVLGYSAPKPEVSDGNVIQARDENGNIAFQQLVNQDTPEEAAAIETANKIGTVERTTTNDALAERARRYAESSAHSQEDMLRGVHRQSVDADYTRALAQRQAEEEAARGAAFDEADARRREEQDALLAHQIKRGGEQETAPTAMQLAMQQALAKKSNTQAVQSDLPSVETAPGVVDKTAAPASLSSVLDTDVTLSGRRPYKTKNEAVLSGRMKKLSGYEPTRIGEGQWVLRKSTQSMETNTRDNGVQQTQGQMEEQPTRTIDTATAQSQNSENVDEVLRKRPQQVLEQAPISEQTPKPAKPINKVENTQEAAPITLTIEQTLADYAKQHATKDKYLSRVRGRFGKNVDPSLVDSAWSQVKGDGEPSAQQAQTQKYTGPDRRKDSDTRKRVSEMSHDEMQKALLTDDLTGLGNRRAYDESAKKAVQVSIDVDSLKWINDNLGHQSGDDLLKVIGKAFLEVVPQDAYHISGDEFIVQADNLDRANDVMAAVVSRLNGVKITYEAPDNRVYQYSPGVSYGSGTSLQEAEQALQQHKATREEEGRRAPRGERPSGLDEVAPAGRDVQDRVAGEEVTSSKIDQAAHEAATSHKNDRPEPTEAQVNAGNYKKGHVTINGLDISIENPAGSSRRPEWPPLKNHYGYIRSLKTTSPSKGLSQRPITASDFFGSGSETEPGGKKRVNSAPVVNNLVSGVKALDSAIFKSLSDIPLGNTEREGNSRYVNSFRKHLESLVEIPSNKALNGIDSLIAKAAHNGSAADAYLFGDSGQGDAIRTKGFDALDIKSKDVVKRNVRAALHDIEIRKAVVSLIPIDVVNMLASAQRPSKRGFNNKAMLLDSLANPSSFDDAVFVGGLVDSISSNLPVAFASWIAKEVSALGNAQGVTFNGLSAKIAGNNWHIKSSNEGTKYHSTIGRDGDHIDVFLGPNAENADLPVFVVDQINPKTRRFDEHKVMLGFENEKVARDAYLSNYEKGWEGIGGVKKFTLDEFKSWLKDGDTTARVAEPDKQRALKAKTQDGKLADKVDAIVSKKQEKIDTSPERVQKTEESRQKGKIEDFGEKIGGNTIQTKETEKGVAFLSPASGKNLRPLSIDVANRTVGRILVDKGWDVSLKVWPTFDSIPEKTKQAIAKYGEDTKVKGVVHDGVLHLVADAHKSEADLETTILHEIKGHIGPRRLYGKDVTAKINELYLAIGGLKGMREIAAKRGITKDLSWYADKVGKSDFDKQMRVHIMMEEILAHIAQEPKFSDRVKAIVGAIRAWLRNHGFAKLAEYGETDLLHVLSQGEKALKTVKTDNGPAVLMVDRPDTDFTNEVLSYLSENDELFRYPISQKRDLAGVMRDVFPEAEYLGEDTRADEHDESGADHRFVFKTEFGKTFYVFERGNDVWIDVSRLAEGEMGSGIYAAIGNYAHNSGKVFIGDPSGLSESAVVRRTSNMLSLALRFGTTDFMEAAPEQVKGAPEKGIAPLEWRGDDLAKTKALIHTFVTTLTNQFPKIKGYRYDFGARSFVDANGRPVSRERFSEGAKGQVARGARTGEATARRGIFLQSLISSESGQRPGILEQALNGGRSLVKNGDLSGMFSRSDSTSLGLTVPVIENLIAPIRKKWTGVDIRVVQSESDLPGHEQRLRSALNNFYSAQDDYLRNMTDKNVDKIRKARNAVEAIQRGSAEGYHAGGNVIYVVANNVPNESRLMQVLAHEAVGHYSMEDMLRSEFAPVLRQIKLMEKAGNKAVKEAAAIVDRTQPGLSEVKRGKEIIAVLAERGIHNSLMTRIKAAVQNFLRSIGINIELNDADLAALLRAAETRLSGGEATGAPRTVEAFSRSNKTKSEYEARIDELFNGGAANRVGARVLDRSDVLNMLGYGDKPVILAESKVIAGKYNHGLTAEHWKKIPEWLEHPAAVFDSETVEGRLVFIAPEKVKGAPVMLIVQPNTAVESMEVNLLVNAYDKTGGKTPVRRWAEEGLLRYVDQNKTRSIFDPSGLQLPRVDQKRSGSTTNHKSIMSGTSGLQLPRVTTHLRRDNSKIFTERDLVKFRASKEGIGQSGENVNGDGSFSRAGGWTAPEISKLDTFLYEVQDKHIDTKRVIQAIVKQEGKIADQWDTHMQEALYHGRAAKRTQDFITDELEPLLVEMNKSGVTQDQLNEYLHARHAEERNRVMQERNPDREDNTDLSGMTNEKAAEILKAADPKMKALANRVDAIIARSRQMLVEYGLEKQETVNAWANQYQHYVPLKREGFDDVAHGNGTGAGFSVRGKSSQEALGSHRAVDNIFANIAMQREKTIVRGEKNRVSVSLLGLAKLNPNKDFWKLDKPAQLTQTNPETGLEEVVPGDMADYAVPKVRHIGKDGTVQERIDPNYKGRNNVIMARVNGEDRAIIFNEHDPRAMRMAEALKNLDADQLGEIIGAIGKVTRYFASINTQYNPVFGVINMMRDVQTAALNLSSTPLKGKKAAVMKEAWSALKGIYKDARAVRKGEHPSSPYADLWEEFQNTGGQTGYRDMFRTAKDRAEAIEHMLDPSWWQKTKFGKAITVNGILAKPEQLIFDKVGRHVFRWLSDYNETMENAVRLAAYKVGKENGMSKDRAAFLAKNLTVNFNKKGRMATQAGALYAFFNASVQGSARIAETLTEGAKPGEVFGKAGKAIIYGGITLGAMQALALMMAGFGDDEPPEFVRERSLIIPAPGTDKGYISIPMPLGFHVLPNIGRTLVEAAVYGKPIDRTIDLLLTTLDAFNPVGGGNSFAQTISPTISDPVIALAENKDWTGKNIYREDFNKLKPTPGFDRTKDSASVISKGLAYGVNIATGGTDYTPGRYSPTPDQIDYLIGQITGGVGREALKSMTTAESLMTGEDLPTYKIPLVGRLVGSASGNAEVRDKFYNNLRELNLHEEEIKGRIGNKEPVNDYLSEHPEASLFKAADGIESKVRELQKVRRQLMEKGEYERAKVLETQTNKLMERFNGRVAQAKTMQPAKLSTPAQ